VSFWKPPRCADARLPANKIKANVVFMKISFTCRNGYPPVTQ
jgi:hypothetical protein